MRWWWQKHGKQHGEDKPVTRQEPVLSPGEGALEVYSPTWKFVSSWAEREIAAARQKNDVVKLSAEETAALRGEIRVLKRFLALPIPAPQVEPEPESDL